MVQQDSHSGTSTERNDHDQHQMKSEERAQGASCPKQKTWPKTVVACRPDEVIHPNFLSAWPCPSRIFMIHDLDSLCDFVPRQNCHDAGRVGDH